MKQTWKLTQHASLIFCLVTILSGLTNATHEDCPWYKRDEGVPNDIKSNCICATNPSSDNQLSVQCQDVNAQNLVSILVKFQNRITQPLELLYLNGSHVTDEDGTIFPKLFADLKIVSLQLSGCKIKYVHEDSFAGTEIYLKHLSLSQNDILSVPTDAIKKLANLSTLDLSYNKITKISKAAFQKLTKLATLKLNDNNLELHPESLIGLEQSLRNINLKGTRISHVPDAIRNLSGLVFLDLAQNRIRELEPMIFKALKSITAINLERNLLQFIPDSVFEGINDTLSSLSLLNNLITNFPKNALKHLHELRVLDLGFNLLTEIPKDAFNGLKSLTLLALDGNPLSTLSEPTFAPLNTSLRGISLGGRFFNCDCRVEWILEWIQEYDLQVTSRERNPQFCGSPTALRTQNFYQIQPQDLPCTKNETIKSEYDVNLSPEDIALLGMGSSGNYESKLDSGSSESSNEQDTSENKTTFTLEAPISTVQRNVTVVKYKPRRPRPTKFTKPPINPTTSTTTTEKIQSSSTEAEVVDDNTGKEVTSVEIDSKIPEANESTSSEDVDNKRQEEVVIISSTTTPKHVVIPSTRSPVRNPPIRANPMRHRITPKVSSSTTETTTTFIPNSLSPVKYEKISKPNIVSVSTSTPTSIRTRISTEKTHNPNISVQPSSFPQRPPTSKTIESFDIDEEAIPIISGIGSAISSPNLNTGSVMSVKQPSVQTQNMNLVPKSLDSMHPSLIHQGPLMGRHPPVPPNLIFADKSDIVVREIVRNSDSVTLFWESPRQAVGFRIIYRLFGEDTFRHGPPLAATETEYRIKNVPNNECMVVCVVPYDEILYNEISPSAASVPPGSQCREVKPMSPSALMNHMDKITIGASAAICITVLVAVIIFIGITRRSKAKRPPSNFMPKIPPTPYLTSSPGTGMGTTSGGYGMSNSKDWDQMSVVSTKSIPRARMYHGSMDGLAVTPPKTATVNPHFHRGGLEGFSTHRSFSAHHHHHNNSSNHLHNHGYQHHAQGNGGLSHGNTASAVNNYLNNQNRLLRTSLGSRASFDALNKLTSTRHSHHQFENSRRKRSSRLNQSESLNTLNGYETPDNWTDHDMDFYVARNHTRHDLVQL